MEQNIQLASGYCDLNIPFCEDGNQTTTKDLVRRALLLGYETIAINVCVNQKDLLSKGQHRQKAKKAKNSGTDNELGLLDFPMPPQIEFNESDYPDLAIKNKAPVILSRLTLTFSNNDFLPIYNNSKAVEKFDIIAINPTSAISLLNLLKSGFKADIIVFDPENSNGNDHGSGDSLVRWNRKLYNECVDKNMYFEIPYSPAIRDSTVRRRVIRQSHIYHAVGKSKNIIISSDAKHVLELRGPHDVANLGHLLGLNEQQGKMAVSYMAAEVVRSAAGRKIGCYRATVQNIDKLSSEESWKIPMLQGEQNKKEESSDENMEESSDEQNSEPENINESEFSMKIYD